MTMTQQPYDVTALRHAHPVASVITGYGIALEPRGQALVGRCPFHADHGRPNLYVYPDSARWYCYRCHVGGDVIDFIRQHDQVGFIAACKRLAGLPAESHFGDAVPRHQPRRWDRLTLHEQIVMNMALATYQETLWRTPAALAYLHRRGLTNATIRACGLGYADGAALLGYLRHRRLVRIAEDLGLLRRAVDSDGTSGLTEFFAGRIVVPELRSGHCIWLIGRTLVDDSSRPKYLALPGERPVLGLERAAVYREVFLCEGVFDYLTAVGWRLPACSPCGTWLPANRLGFLARAATVYGVFDADDAGQAASERFGALFGIRWEPLRLPDGCDLNDLGSRPDGREVFFRLLASEQPTTEKGRHDE